jgi:hypothetical protein
MPAHKPQSQGGQNTGTERDSILPRSCGPRRFTPGRTGGTEPPTSLLKELYESYKTVFKCTLKSAPFFWPIRPRGLRAVTPNFEDRARRTPTWSPSEADDDRRKLDDNLEEYPRNVWGQRGSSNAAETTGLKPARNFLSSRRSLSVLSSTVFLRVHLNAGVTSKCGAKRNPKNLWVQKKAKP